MPDTSPISMEKYATRAIDSAGTGFSVANRIPPRGGRELTPRTRGELAQRHGARGARLSRLFALPGTGVRHLARKRLLVQSAGAREGPARRDGARRTPSA